MSTVNLYDESTLDSNTLSILLNRLEDTGSIESNADNKKNAELLKKLNIKYYPFCSDTCLSIIFRDKKPDVNEALLREIEQNPNFVLLSLQFLQGMSDESRSIIQFIQHRLHRNLNNKEKALDTFYMNLDSNDNLYKMTPGEINLLTPRFPIIMRHLKEEKFTELLETMDRFGAERLAPIVVSAIGEWGVNIENFEEYDLTNSNDCFRLFFDGFECFSVRKLHEEGFPIPPEYKVCLEKNRASLKNSQIISLGESSFYL